MLRLLVNLNTTQCPDYAFSIYFTVRLPFITPDSDHKQVAATLTTVWEAQNTVEKQQWQDQLDQDTIKANERRIESEELEKGQQEEVDNKREEQQKEKRKKNKSKFIPILHRGVPTLLPIIVSALATQRMDKGDYIPLWYFTNVGLDDAAKAFSILEEDVLLLVKRDDRSTSLVPALASKESRSVVEDSKLLWDDFCIAAPHMIFIMSRSEWPPDWITMMTDFWTNINTHPYRSSRDPLDQNTLLLYQVQQRKLWHQAINSPGHRYNLFQINKELMWQTKDRLYWIEREQQNNMSGRDQAISTIVHIHLNKFTDVFMILVFSMFLHFAQYN